MELAEPEKEKRMCEHDTAAPASPERHSLTDDERNMLIEHFEKKIQLNPVKSPWEEKVNLSCPLHLCSTRSD